MRREDPRVTRTRKLIQDAFAELLAEKSFHAISVQDIAERATVNRATFYAHFEDKYALLDHLIRELFREELARHGLHGVPFSLESLHSFIEVVLEFVARFHSQCRPADRDMTPTIEASLQQELSAFLRGWLPQPIDASPEVAPACETAVNVVGWAIFGAGVDWSGHGETDSLAARADQVLLFLTNGLSRVVDSPNGHPSHSDEKQPEQVSA